MGNYGYLWVYLGGIIRSCSYYHSYLYGSKFPYQPIIILVSSDTLTGKPTGQGFGAARKGPAVQGKIEAVVESVYPQGKSFTIGGVKSASTLGVK